MKRAFRAALAVTRFELTHQLRNPALLLSAILAGAVNMAMTLAVLRADPEPKANFSVLSAAAEAHLDWAMAFVFVCAAVVAESAVRDEEARLRSIADSSPLDRRLTQLARWLGVTLAVLTTYCVIPLSTQLAGMLAGDAVTRVADSARLQAIGALAFGAPFLVTASALIFAIGSAVRARSGAYLVATALLLIGLVTSQAPVSAQTPIWMYLADPLGILALHQALRDCATVACPGAAIAWTPITAHHGLWFFVAMGALGLGGLGWLGWLGHYAADPGEAQNTPERGGRTMVAASMSRLPAWLQQLWARFVHEFAELSHNRVLYAMVGLCVLYAAGLIVGTTLMTNPPRYLFTSHTIQMLKTSVGTGLNVILAFYAAEAVWRERRGVALVDVTPVADGVLLGAKALALVAVSGCILVATAAMGIVSQVLNGGPEPDIWAYLAWYVIRGLNQAALIAVLALFVQVLVPGRLIGWTILGGLLLVSMAGSMGGRHHLLSYGSAPAILLTDMNGEGLSGTARGWYDAYWAAVAGALFAGALILWPRGAPQPWFSRGRLAITRLAGPLGWMTVVCLLIAAGLGGYIGLNAVANVSVRKANDGQTLLRELGPTADLNQPVISHVQVALDLHPEARRLEVRGRYTLANRTARPVSCVQIRFPGRDVSVRYLRLEGMRAIRTLPRERFTLFCGNVPMRAGESRILEFASSMDQSGFRATRDSPSLAGNGTALLDTEYAPFVGLVGLPAADRRRAVAPALRPLLDRDLVTTDITVSTPSEQVALAPGDRVEDVVRAGRRTSRFVSTRPIVNFLSVYSAVYDHRTAIGQGGTVDVYYHRPHNMNVPRLLSTGQQALSSYARRFGSSGNSRLTIVETPGYSQSVQAFPGLVAVGERTTVIGGDMRQPGRPDYPSFVLAHEIAHQWWGHELRPSAELGSALLTEGLADYSALSFMDEQCGSPCVAMILSRTWNNYFRQAGDHKREPPLVSMGTQRYLRYSKSGATLFLIADQVGAQKMDRALARFLTVHKGNGRRNPNAGDLTAALRAVARSDQQPLITDLLQQVVLFDFSVLGVHAERRLDGRYDVWALVDLKRTAMGRDRSDAPLTASLEVRLGTEKADLRKFYRVEVRPGQQTIHVITDFRPSDIVLDPHNIWPDRERKNNERAVIQQRAKYLSRSLTRLD
ncbi:MAG: M1 family aminopeptidase [Alphaproteobacteria bacterium]|jgi:ABC-2 type transport system permease protein